MKERRVVIRNRAGIHCRPSAVILNAINDEFPGYRFELAAPAGNARLESLLDILSLELTQGTEAVLKVEGAEPEKALKRIGDLLEYEFDFPPRG